MRTKLLLLAAIATCATAIAAPMAHATDSPGDFAACMRDQGFTVTTENGVQLKDADPFDAKATAAAKTCGLALPDLTAFKPPTAPDPAALPCDDD